jgi:hypothetical protein
MCFPLVLHDECNLETCVGVSGINDMAAGTEITRSVAVKSL